MARLANGEATRRLQVVRVSTNPVDAGPQPRAGARAAAGLCGRALRSCAAYLGRGLCLLGQHFTAGAWSDDADGPPRDDRGRGA